MSDLILTVGLDTKQAEQQTKVLLSDIKNAIEKASTKGTKAKADPSAIEAAKKEAAEKRKIAKDAAAEQRKTAADQRRRERQDAADRLREEMRTYREALTENRRFDRAREQDRLRARHLQLNSAKMTGSAALAEVKRQHREEAKEANRARQIELNSARMAGSAALADVKRKNAEKAKEEARARQIELNSARMAGRAAEADIKTRAAAAKAAAKENTRAVEALARTQASAAKANVRATGAADNRGAGFEMRIDRQLGADPARQAALVSQVRSAVADYKTTVAQFGATSLQAAQAHVKLQGTFQAVNGEIAKHGGLLKNLNDGFGKLSMGGQSLGRILMNTQVALSALAGAFGFRQILDAVVTFEQIRTGLQSVTGSASAGAAEFEFARKMADKYGVSLKDTAQSLVRFRGAAIGTNASVADQREIFENLTVAGRAMSLSTADMGGVFRAVEQMMSKGKVQAEELRLQLGDRLPGAFSAMAQALGVTTSELDKMLKKGEVSSDVLVRFSQVLKDRFAGGIEAAMRGLPAQLGRLSTAIDEAFLKLGQNGFLEGAARAIERLTMAISSGGADKAIALFGNLADIISKSLVAALDNASTLMMGLTGVALVKMATGLWGVTSGATSATGAMLALSRAMLANPMMVFATVAAGALLILGQMRDQMMATERATINLQKAGENNAKALNLTMEAVELTRQAQLGNVDATNTQIQAYMSMGDAAKDAGDKAVDAARRAAAAKLSQSGTFLSDAAKEQKNTQKALDGTPAQAKDNLKTFVLDRPQLSAALSRQGADANNPLHPLQRALAELNNGKDLQQVQQELLRVAASTNQFAGSYQDAAGILGKFIEQQARLRRELEESQQQTRINLALNKAVLKNDLATFDAYQKANTEISSGLAARVNISPTLEGADRQAAGGYADVINDAKNQLADLRKQLIDALEAGVIPPALADSINAYNRQITTTSTALSTLNEVETTRQKLLELGFDATVARARAEETAAQKTSALKDLTADNAKVYADYTSKVEEALQGTNAFIAGGDRQLSITTHLVEARKAITDLTRKDGIAAVAVLGKTLNDTLDPVQYADVRKVLSDTGFSAEGVAQALALMGQKADDAAERTEFLKGATKRLADELARTAEASGALGQIRLETAAIEQRTEALLKGAEATKKLERGQVGTDAFATAFEQARSAGANEADAVAEALHRRTAALKEHDAQFTVTNQNVIKGLEAETRLEQIRGETIGKSQMIQDSAEKTAKLYAEAMRQGKEGLAAQILQLNNLPASAPQFFHDMANAIDAMNNAARQNSIASLVANAGNSVATYAMNNVQKDQHQLTTLGADSYATASVSLSAQALEKLDLLKSKVKLKNQEDTSSLIASAQELYASAKVAEAANRALATQTELTGDQIIDIQNKAAKEIEDAAHRIKTNREIVEAGMNPTKPKTSPAERVENAFENQRAKLLQVVEGYINADEAARNYYENVNLAGKKFTAGQQAELASLKNLGTALKELNSLKGGLDSAISAVEVDGADGSIVKLAKLSDKTAEYRKALDATTKAVNSGNLAAGAKSAALEALKTDTQKATEADDRYIAGLQQVSKSAAAEAADLTFANEVRAVEISGVADAAERIDQMNRTREAGLLVAQRSADLSLLNSEMVKLEGDASAEAAKKREALTAAIKATNASYDAKETKKALAEQKRAIDAELKGPMGQAFKDFHDSISEGITDAFASAFDKSGSGWEDFLDNMKSSFKKMLAAMAFEAYAKPIIMPMMQQVGTSVFGLSSQAAASITGANVAGGGGGSGGPGVMDIAQNGMSLASNSGVFSGIGSSIYGPGTTIGTALGTTLVPGTATGAISQSGSLAAAYTTGPISGSAGGATVGSALAGGAGVAAGGFLAGSLVGGYFGNKAQSKAVGGLSGAASGAVAGAVIGSFVPVIGTAIGAIIGGIAGALGGILGTAGKPSNKEGNATYDLAKRKVTAIGGQTGKKFSQENRDAASATVNDVGVLGQALELVSGKKLASQIKVTVGSRDGIIGETNGQKGSFKATEEGYNQMVRFFSKSFTDQLGDSLPKDVRTALSHIDFKDMEKALGDIEFAAGFQDQLKSLRAEFGLVDSVTADAKAQVSALVTGIADFKGKAAALGLDVNAAADATRNFVDAFINGRDQKTYTEMEAAVATVNARFAAMTPLLKEVGYSAGEAAIAIQNGLNKALDTLRVTFVQGLDAQLNELTGKGYINQIAGLTEQFGLAQRDAAALGVGMDKVNQIFQLSAQKIVDEAGISGAALDELMRLFPQLAGKLVGATADAAEEAEKALKLLQSRQQMEVKLLQLMKRDTAALALSRQLEMEAMDASLRPLQAQIHALEDLSAAEDKVAAARQNAVDAIDREITKQNEAADAARGRMDSYGTLASGLKDFRTSLLMGELSPLTADQKYNEARNAFAQNVTKAQGGDVGAIEQLQGTGQTFLELSRTLFASSEAYYRDFDLVQTALLSTESLATLQYNLAKGQLDGITATVAALDAQKLAIQAVEAAVLTIPEALHQLDLSLRAMALAQSQADTLVGAGPVVSPETIAQYVPSASGGGGDSLAPAMQKVAVAVVQGNATNEQALAELAKQMAAMSDAIVEQQDALNRMLNKR